MFGLMHGNLTQFLYAAAILLSGGPLSILLSFGSLIVMLAEIVAANNGLWCAEAEKYLLANAKAL